MAMRLLGQDCTINIYDGGAFVTGGPTYTGAINVKAFAKSISVDDTVTTESLRGLGDAREKKRPKFAETKVAIELLIEDSGPVVLTLGGFVKVVYEPIATVGTRTLQGVLVGNKTESPDGAATQSLSIECDADTL